MINIILSLLVLTVTGLVMSGRLVPRRELAQAKVEAAELQTATKELEPALMIITQIQVLEWLPQWMVADFDCPRGPHEFLPRVTSRGNHYEFCHHCKRMKREVDEWPDDTRDPLEVIYDLQFGRR